MQSKIEGHDDEDNAGSVMVGGGSRWRSVTQERGRVTIRRLSGARQHCNAQIHKYIHKYKYKNTEKRGGRVTIRRL